MSSSTRAQEGSARTAVLVAALLVASLGLSLWPMGREKPSMPTQAWSDPPPAGHPAVVRPPADARAEAGAHGDCDTQRAASPRSHRGT